MSDDHPTSIRLDPNLKKDLVRYAKAQGCSLKWLVADILAKWNEWKKEQEKSK